jgi:hypothetical protein
VGLDFSGDLRAELEPPVFLVFRVVLDQEPPAVGVIVLSEFDDSSADGQDAGGEIQVADPYLGQFASAHPAFDVGFHQQLGVSVG